MCNLHEFIATICQGNRKLFILEQDFLFIFGVNKTLLYQDNIVKSFHKIFFDEFFSKDEMETDIAI